jgi:protein SCO1/2
MSSPFMVGQEAVMWKRSFLFLLILLLGSCSKPEMPSPFHAIDITWQNANANFQLTDHNGNPRTLQSFAGKVIVLFFGYTHCPEVCPTTLADLAQVMRYLGKDGHRVQVLFITLDPERDKPELLARFVPVFDQSFLGLYGDTTATDLAAKSFGVKYEKKYTKNNGYTLDHSDGIYLIGIKGRPILLSPYAQNTEFLVQDIKMLLAIGQ